MVASLVESAAVAPVSALPVSASLVGSLALVLLDADALVRNVGDDVIAGSLSSAHATTRSESRATRDRDRFVHSSGDTLPATCFTVDCARARKSCEGSTNGEHDALRSYQGIGWHRAMVTPAEEMSLLDRAHDRPHA